MFQNTPKLTKAEKFFGMLGVAFFAAIIIFGCMRDPATMKKQTNLQEAEDKLFAGEWVDFSEVRPMFANGNFLLEIDNWCIRKNVPLMERPAKVKQLHEACLNLRIQLDLDTPAETATNPSP